MKNTLIGLLFGALIALSLNGVTTTSTQIVKPAQPKSWVIDYGDASRIQQTMLSYQKKGYIVNQIEFDSYRREAIVVMYKYY